MTRFRMLLIVVGSAVVFTFVGPFLYKAVGLDSPVGTCSPVGNSSPVGNNSPVGSNSPVGNCSPVSGNQARTRIFNTLSGGGQSGQVITVPSGTAVTDQATLHGRNVGGQPPAAQANVEAQSSSGASSSTGAGGTVTYDIYSLSPHQWGWTSAGSGGTVTVVNGVVPASKPVTLDPGVYAWKASYSGDALNAPSKSFRGSGIEIVLHPGSQCPTGSGWQSVGCFQHSHHGGNGFGNNGGGDDNHGGNGFGNNGGGNDNHGGNGFGNNGGGNDDHGGNSYSHYDNGGMTGWFKH